MKTIITFIALVLAPLTFAAPEYVTITGGTTQTLQVRATQYRTVMVRQEVDTTCTISCYPTEDEPYRCLGVPDVTYACREWQTLPEQRFAHHIDATVTIEVKAPANGQTFSETLSFNLNNGRITTRIDGGRNGWTVAEVLTLTKEPLQGDIQKMSVKMVFTPHDRKAFHESIAVRNAAYARGVLTYETGVPSTMPIMHQVLVKNHGGLFQRFYEGKTNLGAPHLVTEPFAGGLRHSVNLRAAGVRYKKGQNEVTLQVKAHYDPKKPHEGFATDDGYSASGQHQFTIRIR
jgi:hypothetical protein